MGWLLSNRHSGRKINDMFMAITENVINQLCKWSVEAILTALGVLVVIDQSGGFLIPGSCV